MSSYGGIIYGLPTFVRRTWADRYGRRILIGLVMMVSPIFVVHALSRTYTLFPRLLPFETLNSFVRFVDVPFGSVMYGGALLIGVTGLQATAHRARMQETKTSPIGIAISLAVLAALLWLWIDDSTDWWNVVSTGVVVAYLVSLLSRTGGWWALVIGTGAVILAGILIGNPSGAPPRNVSIIAVQVVWAFLPMIGMALLGVMIRKRFSTSSDRP